MHMKLGRIGFVLAALLSTGCPDGVLGGGSAPMGGTGVFDDDDDGPGEGSCCEAHPGAGCDNGLVRECVCEGAPQCCEDGWSAQCVDLVESMACGQCGDAGSCCQSSSSPGCETPAVRDCVCAADPFCCADVWDAQCVADVFLFECGSCPGNNPCCAADDEPGCNEPEIQACVCTDEPQCCVDGWTFACVEAIEDLECGICRERGSSSSGGTTSTTSGTTSGATTTSRGQ